jgi:hypothetical protein
VHHYSGELTLLLVKQDVIKCVSSLPCFFGNRPSGNGDDKPGEMMTKQMTNPKAGSSSAGILKGNKIRLHMLSANDFTGLCLVMLHVHISEW